MKYGSSRMKKGLNGRNRPNPQYGGKSDIPRGSGKAKTGLDDTSVPNTSYANAGAKVVQGKAKNMC